MPSCPLPCVQTPCSLSQPRWPSFKARLNSPFVVLKDNLQVAEAGDYLAERLATMAMLVDKSTPRSGGSF